MRKNSKKPNRTIKPASVWLAVCMLVFAAGLMPTAHAQEELYSYGDEENTEQAGQPQEEPPPIEDVPPGVYDEAPEEEAFPRQDTAQTEGEGRYTAPRVQYPPPPKSEEELWQAFEDSGLALMWNAAMEEELVPKGFVQVQKTDGNGDTFYTLEDYQREAGAVPVATAAELRAAVLDAVDGDEILLQNSIELGAGAMDASPLPLKITEGITLTIKSEGGEYTLYRTDTARHFVLQNADETRLLFESVTLHGGTLGGGIEVLDSTGVQLEGVRLTACAAQQGGALSLTGSTASLTNGNITENTAAAGGGLYLQNSSVELLGATTVGQNSAKAGEAKGGGVYVCGDSTLRLDDEVAVQYNWAFGTQQGMGGGVYLGSGGVLHAGASARLEHNQAMAENGRAYGGGVYLAVASEAEITGQAVLCANSADIGGGVYLNEAAQLTLDGAALLSRNSAAAGGGGICAYAGAACSVQGAARLDANTAPEGGAVYAYNLTDIKIDEGVVFENNTASGGLAPDEGQRQVHTQQVAAQSNTHPFDTLYNNYDIGYPGGEEVTLHTVRFMYNDGERGEYHTQNMLQMQQLPMPAPPQREGYTFTGWHTDAEATRLLRTAQTIVVGDMVLYAGWQVAAQDTGEGGPLPDTALQGSPQGAAGAAEGDTYAEGIVLEPVEWEPVAQGEPILLVPNPPEGSWSLVNLIAGLVCFTASVLMLIGLISRRGQADRMGFAWALVGILAGAAGMGVFLATANVAGEMVMVDGFSPLLLGLLILQTATVALLRLNGEVKGSPGRYWSGHL